MDHFLDHLHLNRLRSLPAERRWKHPSTPLPRGLQSSSGSTSLVLVCLGPLPIHYTLRHTLWFPASLPGGFFPGSAPPTPPRSSFSRCRSSSGGTLGPLVLTRHAVFLGACQGPQISASVCVQPRPVPQAHTDSQPLSFTCTWMCQRHGKLVHPNIPPQPLPTPSPGLPISAQLPVSIQQGHRSHTSLGSALLLSPLPHVQTTTNPLDIAS